MIKFIYKNCKHWESDSWSNFPWMGDCNSDKFIDISRDYELNRSEKKSLYQKTDVLLYWDGEGIEGDFKTGENFGCVHFECNGIVLSDGEIVANNPPDFVTEDLLTGEFDND